MDISSYAAGSERVVGRQKNQSPDWTVRTSVLSFPHQKLIFISKPVLCDSFFPIVIHHIQKFRSHDSE